MREEGCRDAGNTWRWGNLDVSSARCNTRTPLMTPEHSDLESHSHPAVVASPVHCHQWRESPGICAQTDLEVWDLLDEDIISKFCYILSLTIMLQLLFSCFKGSMEFWGL